MFVKSLQSYINKEMLKNNEIFSFSLQKLNPICWLDWMDPQYLSNFSIKSQP